jgi:hypothetical protein
MKSIYVTAKQLIAEKLPEIRAHLRNRPRPTPPAIRRAPTTGDLWRRYVSSMITSQQRITPDLWRLLDADERWRALQAGGPRACPQERSLVRLLRDHGLRFPTQKARRIRLGASRDFGGLADLARSILREAHDRTRHRRTLRREELRLACAVQEELAGCGVAPKIARLILVLTGTFEHVIPIDSRWMAALESAGADVGRIAVAREATYQIVEEQIVSAAYDLGVLPVFADGAIFGWLETNEPEEGGR